jgi:hypothetical protein
MSQRPLKFISREKEYELINRIQTIVDDSEFDPATTAVMMVSPDYSATAAMVLAHGWSRGGDMLEVIPVSVTFPDETADFYIKKLEMELKWRRHEADGLPKKLVLVEAGIIRGGNWAWILDVLYSFGYQRSDITLVALCENIHSRVKSDYVGEYYDDDLEDLTFHFERFNKHWPVK